MEFNKVCVYGGGVIGGAWAVSFAMKGVATTIYDLDDQKLAATKEEIRKSLLFLASPEVKVLSVEQTEAYLKLISFTTDVKKAVEDMPLIQECVPENLKLKRSVINVIEQFNTTGIIASSTSGMSIDDISAEAKHPERIIVGHPYNPVYLMPLVEIVKGEKTSEETLGKLLRFYKELGKEPVVLNKFCPGFICSRIQGLVIREAMSLIMRGICSVEDFDKAVTYGPGLRWALIGPHLVYDTAAGKYGLAGALAHFGAGASSYFEDASDAKTLDPEYGKVAVAGVEAEKAHRLPEQGQDLEGIERFRDLGLVELLKYHGKL